MRTWTLRAKPRLSTRLTATLNEIIVTTATDAPTMAPRPSREHQQLPAFAAVSLGELKILLSGPGASGSRPMPDGQRQQPGGWNRVVLRVSDLAECIATLKNNGARFRNELQAGPGGKQIQLEDPDGNPIELFEPAQRAK